VQPTLITVRFQYSYITYILVSTQLSPDPHAPTASAISSYMLKEETDEPQEESADVDISEEGGNSAPPKPALAASSWYPGKYLGLRNAKQPVSSTGSSDQSVQSTTGTAETSSADVSPAEDCNSIPTTEQSAAASGRNRSPSSSSSSAFSWFSWSGHGVATGQGEAAAGDIEDAKKESMITTTVRNIRAKFLNRQLIGKIYIYRLSGVISTAVMSDITADDVARHLLEAAHNKDIFDKDELLTAELTGNYKRALTTTDTILNSLERRSLAWQGCDFAGTTLLTRGTTLGVSDPIVGLIGFSFTLELSATVHSLLASRKRFEAARELATELAAINAAAEGDSSSVAARPSLLASMSISNMFRSSSTSSNVNTAKDEEAAAATAALLSVDEPNSNNNSASPEDKQTVPDAVC
jgi:hypothetical protein